MYCLYIIFAFLGTYVLRLVHRIWFGPPWDDLKNANTDFLVQEICSEVRKTLKQRAHRYLL